MRAIRVTIGTAICGLLIGGLVGCESTEPTGTKLDSVPATGANGGPPPKNQAEYHAQQQAAQGSGNPYGPGYPGGSGPKGR